MKVEEYDCHEASYQTTFNVDNSSAESIECSIFVLSATTNESIIYAWYFRYR